VSAARLIGNIADAIFTCIAELRLPAILISLMVSLSNHGGETKKSELKGASKSMYESMSETQLEEFAETDRKGLPNKVKPKR
jgi:hypothetical protein